MKHTSLILLVLAGLLSTSCFRGESKFSPYTGGLAPDQVRAKMDSLGCDYAIIADGKTHQTVIFSWRDSADCCYLMESYTDDNGNAIADESPLWWMPFEDWSIVPIKGGAWRVKYTQSEHPIFRYGTKFSDPKLTDDGVAFYTKFILITSSRCLFLAADRSLETVDFFSRPELRTLLAFASIFGVGSDDRTLSQSVADTTLCQGPEEI